MWQVWLGVLVSAALLVLALVTAVRANQLDANGVTGQAEVVAVNLGTRADFVRVRLESGREVDLWVWSGRPEVGTTMAVVYLEDGSRVKQAGTFLPRSFWGSLLGTVAFGGLATGMFFTLRRRAND
jgi:hypothetical protein